MKAFVYGSLKYGLPNHSLLGRSEFVMDTITAKKYDMVSMGDFPAVKESVETAFIQGEVYEINGEILDRLDHLESDGIFYTRKLIFVDYLIEPVWMYFIMNEMGAGFDMTNVDESDTIHTWLKY